MSSPVARAEELLAYAARRVPWWREAVGRAPGAWSPERLPAMDRALVSERFDDLVADRAVGREEAVARYRRRPETPWRDGIRVFVSAGAHGEPVPLLYDEEAWRSYLRAIRAALAAAGAPPDGTLALVGTDDPAHTLWRLQELAPPGRAVAIGLQEGVERACERLEALRPDAVYGIASAIELVAERHPQIAPVAVLTCTDALGPAGRTTIRQAFGVDPLVSYGLTETGLVAAQCRRGGAMHASEESLLLEHDGGSTYATNLANRIQPMLRFRLPERPTVTWERCACGGSPMRLRLTGGRTASVWRVPGANGGTVALHPIVLRSALDPLVLPRLPSVRWDGQILQVSHVEDDAAEISGRLRRALQRAGADPEVLAVSPADEAGA